MGIFLDVTEGNIFEAFHNETLSSGATTNLQLKVPSGITIKLISSIITSTDYAIRAKIVENPTVTDGSTSIDTFDSNFQTANSKSFNFYNDPTSISGGTTKRNILIPATTSGPGGSIIAPFTIEKRNRIIFAENEDYLFQFVNQDGSNPTDIDCQFVFQEL